MLWVNILFDRRVYFLVSRILVNDVLYCKFCTLVDFSILGQPSICLLSVIRSKEISLRPRWQHRYIWGQVTLHYGLRREPKMCRKLPKSTSVYHPKGLKNLQGIFDQIQLVPIFFLCAVKLERKSKYVHVGRNKSMRNKAKLSILSFVCK